MTQQQPYHPPVVRELLASRIPPRGFTLRATRTGARTERRSLPCLHLGDQLYPQDTVCPVLRMRGCAVHERCNLLLCLECPDYDPAE